MIKGLNKKNLNKYNFIDDLREIQQNYPLEEKYDSKQMQKQLKHVIDSIISKNIITKQDFVTPLKEFGFNRNDKKLLIEEYAKHINIYLLKKRELEKSSDLVKNILFNRLASENPEDFLSFFTNYIKEKYPYRPYTDILLKDFKSNVDQLKKQIINVSNSNNLAEINDISEQLAMREGRKYDLYFISWNITI